MGSFAFYFLPFAALLVLCNGIQFSYPSSNAKEPKVYIERVNNMSPGMQADAVDFLKAAYLTDQADSCSILRKKFGEKYHDNNWHAVMYKAYSIQYVKSIDLKVGNDHVLLFATH